MSTVRRKSKKRKMSFISFLKRNKKSKTNKNKSSNKVAPKSHSKSKKKHKKRAFIISLKRFCLKSIRNVLIILGLVLICFTFFFEVKTVNSSTGLFNLGKELVFIEKWQMNSIHPIKLHNDSTVMLKDSTIAVVLASWENKVSINNNNLVIDGRIEGKLPTLYTNNTTFLLSDNEYLILSSDNRVAVVNTDMIKGELSGRYRSFQHF